MHSKRAVIAERNRNILDPLAIDLNNKGTQKHAQLCASQFE
jgi:hypothetical protein